eukprot:362025-Chlamydomonas_euryale.AAC.5
MQKYARARAAMLPAWQQQWQHRHQYTLASLMFTLAPWPVTYVSLVQSCLNNRKIVKRAAR